MNTRNPSPKIPLSPTRSDSNILSLIDGRLHVDGQWVFLKIAKPLRNFADPREVQQLIDDLPVLQAKHYNAIAINCYWHHFDRDGDGVLDASCAPLSQLIDAIAARGMFPCLSVETYGVGGGTVPAGFWKQHPDAVAVNSDGKPVRDSEYGFGSSVPSLFCLYTSGCARCAMPEETAS